MKRLIVPAAVVIAMTGCIIYEEDVVYDEEFGLFDREKDDDGSSEPGDSAPGADEPGVEDPQGDDPGVDDPGVDDPGSDDQGSSDPEPAAPAAVTLYPSGGEVGTTVIVSVVVNIEADLDIDLTTIQDITFYGEGDLSIVTGQSRNADEYILVVDIPTKTLDTSNDLLLEFADGSAVFVYDAFGTVPEGADAPQDFFTGFDCPE